MTSSNVLLRTEDLSLSYGRIKAVDKLNITVGEGEIYGFLGRNGAGKTSTIRMLMGLIRPDSGRIELLDFRGRRIGVKQKQRIGYVSQEQFFYPWMTCAGLGQFVAGFYPTWDQTEFSRLIDVLDLPGDRKSGHLSGGMKVKLALALALAHRPPILILDEPTSGLDPVSRREFLEIIRLQARGNNRTTFFSSHLIDEVERVADRVGMIHKGRLHYEGDIETLQTSVRSVRYDRANESREIPATLGKTDSSESVVSEHPVVAEAAVDYPEAGGDELPEDEQRAEPFLAELASELQPGGQVSAPVPPSPTHDRQLEQEFRQQAEARGFTILRNDFEDASALILRGSSEAWEAAPFPRESIRRLSLEDIFIALAGEEIPQL